MKTTKFFIVACLLGTLLFSSCKYNAGDRIPGTSSAKIDSVSYALGVWFGGTLKSSDFGELNKCQIQKGIKDMIEGKELKISEEEIMQIIQNYLMQRQTYKTEKSLTDGKEFLEKNKAKEGVVTLESGVQYKIITEGTGVLPVGKDTVEVNYKGTLVDGTEFDSSYKRGEAVKFPLNQVIPGWSEGLSYCKEGGKIEIYIPAEKGYGERTNGPIPGNSTLIFEVELVKVYPVVEAPESDIKK
jgi:FKBP-type peptidyl-prolyl cis-trans isomerase